MTLTEAFIQFTESSSFKEVAKLDNAQGAKFRIYLARFKADKLRSGAIVELLIANGYEIKANKVTKKGASKKTR
jgi:hypothetical protein